jgi:hypothetical protein
MTLLLSRLNDVRSIFRESGVDGNSGRLADC